MKGLAIAWLLEEDWPEWNRIDPGFAQQSYQRWLSRAELTYRMHQNRGTNIHKIVVRPSEAVDYCADHGGDPDGDVRMRIAVSKMIVKEEGKGAHIQ